MVDNQQNKEMSKMSKTSESTSYLDPSSSIELESKDLMKQDGVLDLLNSIKERSDKESLPIILLIDEYLKYITCVEDRQFKLYIILRELKGIIRLSFHNQNYHAPTFKKIFDHFALQGDPVRVKNILGSHTYTIPFKRATILNVICSHFFV